MAQIRHLPNAPIVEAVIDFRASFAKAHSLAEIEQFVSLPELGYSRKSFVMTGQLAIAIGTVTSIPPAQAIQPNGLRVHSSDEKYVLTVTQTGLTISRLPPYQDWERLLDEAMRIWRLYRQTLSPIGVTRAATRYINNLRLPLRDGDPFEMYIRKFGEIPELLPQAVSEFLARYVLSDAKSGNRVIVATSFQGSPPNDAVPIMLDIDAFAERSMGIEEHELRGVLNDLRALKNDCFFGVLTESALALYE